MPISERFLDRLWAEAKRHPDKDSFLLKLGRLYGAPIKKFNGKRGEKWDASPRRKGSVLNCLVMMAYGGPCGNRVFKKPNETMQHALERIVEHDIVTPRSPRARSKKPHSRPRSRPRSQPRSQPRSRKGKKPRKQVGYVEDSGVEDSGVEDSGVEDSEGLQKTVRDFGNMSMSPDNDNEDLPSGSDFELPETDDASMSMSMSRPEPEPEPEPQVQPRGKAKSQLMPAQELALQLVAPAEVDSETELRRYLLIMGVKVAPDDSTLEELQALAAKQQWKQTDKDIVKMAESITGGPPGVVSPAIMQALNAKIRETKEASRKVEPETQAFIDGLEKLVEDSTKPEAERRELRACLRKFKKFHREMQKQANRGGVINQQVGGVVAGKPWSKNKTALVATGGTVGAVGTTAAMAFGVDRGVSFLKDRAQRLADAKADADKGTGKGEEGEETGAKAGGEGEAKHGDGDED